MAGPAKFDGCMGPIQKYSLERGCFSEVMFLILGEQEMEDERREQGKTEGENMEAGE